MRIENPFCLPEGLLKWGILHAIDFPRKSDEIIKLYCVVSAEPGDGWVVMFSESDIIVKTVVIELVYWRV